VSGALRACRTRAPCGPGAGRARRLPSARFGVPPTRRPSCGMPRDDPVLERSKGIRSGGSRAARETEAKAMGDAWIVDAVRTPRGRGKKDSGSLSGVHPQELLAQVLEALRLRNGFDPRDVEDVVAGCVSAVGEQGACIARMAVLAAGWDPKAASGV